MRFSMFLGIYAVVKALTCNSAKKVPFHVYL